MHFRVHGGGAESWVSKLVAFCARHVGGDPPKVVLEVACGLVLDGDGPPTVLFLKFFAGPSSRWPRGPGSWILCRWLGSAKVVQKVPKCVVFIDVGANQHLPDGFS